MELTTKQALDAVGNILTQQRSLKHLEEILSAAAGAEQLESESRKKLADLTQAIAKAESDLAVATAALDSAKATSEGMLDRARNESSAILREANEKSAAALSRAKESTANSNRLIGEAKQEWNAELLRLKTLCDEKKEQLAVLDRNLEAARAAARETLAKLVKG